MNIFIAGEEGKRHPVASKFHEDSDGNFWEERGTVGGRKFYVPAPEWAGNINPYLFEGPNIIIGTHPKPLSPNVPEIRAGGKITDGGNLLMTTAQKDELLRTDPNAEKFIRPFMGGREFINRISRWCLWMVGVEPADIRKCPRVLERIESVRLFRQKSKKEATRRKAETPALFDEIVECKTDYLAIPKTSSENRRYIPIGWLTPDVIAGDALFVCENATLYQFGILNSSVHMAWVRKISGRLEISYRYSNTLDYNAFPWPILPPPPVKPGEKPKVHPSVKEIESTAQGILNARALYPKSSLADLYDERTMPPELRKAHRANDDAVMRAYGFTRHYEDEAFHDENIVINLMYMYQDLTGCEEFKGSYPNRELWLSYYPEDDDEEY